MTQLSLGLIETIGLAAAIEAADAAVKSANVVLVGYELTRGDGMVVVKIEGDVGAVNAAVAAAAVAAARVNRVIATRVIARPAAGIAAMVVSAETAGVQRQPVPAASPVAAAEPAPAPTPESGDQQTAATAPVDAVPAQIGSDEEQRRSPDAGQQPIDAEQSAPSSSRQAKTGGRSTAGNNAKHRNRHGA